MKIIVVTPAVPHPFGDTAARWSYVLITELLARGNEAEKEIPQDRPLRACDNSLL